MIRFLLLSILMICCLAPLSLRAGECTVEAVIDGEIGAATLDFIERAEKRAQERQCNSLLLLINTPGGNLQTTRMIVEGILNSKVPVLCYVYPAGAHAGSAGAIILQSCHVAGAVDATNIGAATPISEGGANIPSDLRKKILNDTKSWVVSLAKLRGRNETFAQKIIEDATALSASDSLKIKAIDFVGTTKEQFLKFAQGRTVMMSEGKTAVVKVGEVNSQEQDLRYRLMDFLMNPQVTYMIFMASIALLYFEITHPGMIAPGVIGGLGLLISLVSMHLLAVTWGSVLLIVAGIGLMVAEAFTPGFGILGVGGIASFLLGSLFLFDPEQSGVYLPLSIILPTVTMLSALMLSLAYIV
ncbi:MAG: nodulation protein NfeD, partial [Bdellovibrionales bacterium]